MEKKVTEREVLNAVIEAATTAKFEGKVTMEDVVAYCEKKLAQADAKAEKDKERRAAKAKENDELLETVKGAVTEEYQTAQEITDAIGDAEITKGKVVNRLTKLVNDGVIVKAEIKVEGAKNKSMAYKLA